MRTSPLGGSVDETVFAVSEALSFDVSEAAEGVGLTRCQMFGCVRSQDNEESGTTLLSPDTQKLSGNTNSRQPA